MKYSFVMALACVLLLAPLALSQEKVPDTHENRLIAADRYLEHKDFSYYVDDHLEPFKNISKDERVKQVGKQFNVCIIKNIAKNTLVKHYTADELNALADLYDREIFKEIEKKTPAYLTDFNSQLQRKFAQIWTQSFSDNHPESTQPDCTPEGSQK